MAAVKPGDAFFARCDVRFSHEYVTPMAEALFRQGFGPDAKVTEPESVFAFRDHLTFLDLIMPKAHKDMGLDVQARKLATVQDDFAKRVGIRLYGEVHRDGKLVGSEAICHNKVVEELALPGQLVIGTDSHTCMAGALGCFAFGVGSTDMANAWMTRDVRVTVPETARFELTGKLRPGVCAKDVMLHILSQPFFKGGDGIGKVLEFGGDGVAQPAARRARDADEHGRRGGRLHGHHRGRRGRRRLPRAAAGRRAPTTCGARIVQADPGATYCATFDDRPAAIAPMVATPGDPRNGVPLAALGAGVKIDIAYGGSCTGGKKADMDMYARVLGRRGEEGKRVARGGALLPAVRVAGHPPLRRGEGLPRGLRAGGAPSSSTRPAARASRRARLERLARPGHRQRAEPQLPRAGAARARSTSRAPSSSPRAPSRGASPCPRKYSPGRNALRTRRRAAVPPCGR